MYKQLGGPHTTSYVHTINEIADECILSLNLTIQNPTCTIIKISISIVKVEINNNLPLKKLNYHIILLNNAISLSYIPPKIMWLLKSLFSL
jgi:hypothetical protein